MLIFNLLACLKPPSIGNSMSFCKSVGKANKKGQ